MPALLEHEVTAVYVGLRTASDQPDYRIEADERYVCVAGIRSTGLTASMAIAEHVRGELEAAGLALEPRRRKFALEMPNIGELAPRPYERGGRIVCFCERVTEEEIEGALRATVPPADLDGLRRRTRVLMGRCQGFFCGAEVRALLERR
jgi:glycerol-3-phosphate dehydrogenase